MMKTGFVYLVAMALFLVSSTSGFATSEPPSTDKAIASSSIAPKKEETAPDIGALGPSSPQPKKAIEHTYVQMTYESLYKLAWSYDAFAVTNDEALNTFLMITECTLYNKFFQNEFEWEKIKIATREFLKNNKTSVPRYYEYAQPIVLGRYDYQLQGFPIVDSRDFRAQKNFQFASFASGVTTCGTFDISQLAYPSTAVLTVTSPLNLSFIRVPIPLAQKYIEWRNRQGMFNDDKRQAYIRYRIRVDGYDGMKTFAIGLNSFSFRGKLMRLDVFADQEMLLPLYNQVF